MVEVKTVKSLILSCIINLRFYFFFLKLKEKEKFKILLFKKHIQAAIYWNLSVLSLHNQLLLFK